VGSDDVVGLRTLQTDRAVGDQWLVTSGLNPGDRVIVEGIQFAKPGSKVVAEEYRPATEEKKAVRQSAAGSPGATE
jgi:membrane fusion protein (multidrug efflux system)